MERTYDVTVWDTLEGGVRDCKYDITESELDELHEHYSDDPFADVVIDESREVEDDPRNV